MTYNANVAKKKSESEWRRPVSATGMESEYGGNVKKVRSESEL